jgi:hypothetical protein
MLCKNNPSEIRAGLFYKKNKTVSRYDIDRIAWCGYWIEMDKGIKQGKGEGIIFLVCKKKGK